MHACGLGSCEVEVIGLAAVAWLRCGLAEQGT